MQTQRRQQRQRRPVAGITAGLANDTIGGFEYLDNKEVFASMFAFQWLIV